MNPKENLDFSCGVCFTNITVVKHRKFNIKSVLQMKPNSKYAVSRDHRSCKRPETSDSLKKTNICDIKQKNSFIYYV